ncbi:MAG: hypothetical protein RTU30_03190 [Candidatus Thorarchaeota archaeon]
MRRKLQLGLLMMFLGSMCFQPASVEASAPTAIELSYDYESQKLFVDVDHYSDDVYYHRVGSVVVYRNYEYYRIWEYAKQTDIEGLEVELKVPAEPGDVITVIALCSGAWKHSGHYVTGEIVVEGPPEPTTTMITPQPTTTDSFISPSPQIVDLFAETTPIPKVILSIWPFMIGVVVVYLAVLAFAKEGH